MNWLAILVVVIIHQILGFVWYSPQVFGNVWFIEATPANVVELQPQIGLYIFAVVAALMLTVMFSYFVEQTGVRSAWDGVQLGVLFWLGFVFPIMAMHYLFMQYSFRLIAIDTGKELLGLIISGIILATWRKNKVPEKESLDRV